MAMQKTWDMGAEDLASPAALKAAFVEFVATAAGISYYVLYLMPEQEASA